jgi:Tfp pilus assembly protein PilF
MNKALLINPKMWQVYMTRASYFGLIGKYNKGIQSCNQALQLQPQCTRA